MKPFEAGKTYKTRDGRSVRILCTDVKDGGQPIAGLLSEESNNESMQRWCADGKYWESETSPGPHDLIPETNTVTVWLTLYEKGVGGVYCSLEDADRWADKNGCGIGKFLRIQEFTYEVES